MDKERQIDQRKGKEIGIQRERERERELVKVHITIGSSIGSKL